MTGEGPPIPVKVAESPPTATVPPPAAEIQSVGTPPVPQGESVPPASAEKIPGVTLDSAHKQVLGWVGEVDPNKDPQVIINQANKIREGGTQPPLTLTPENIAIIKLAQEQERTNRAAEAKQKLEAEAKTPKPEEPPEEIREQIKNRIDTAWEKGMELLVKEAKENLWDENAAGITLEEKDIRVAARRMSKHIEASNEYDQQMIEQRNKDRQTAGEIAMTDADTVEFKQKLHQELRTNPAKLKTKQYAYDEKTRQYVIYDTDGKTEIDRFAPADLVEPARAGLKRIAEKVESDGKPTARATEAQNIRQVLEKYYIEGRGFPARTESELQAEKANKEVIDVAWETLRPSISSELEEAIKAGKVDIEAIKAHPKTAVGRAVVLLYQYHQGGITDETTKQTIVTSLFLELNNIAAEGKLADNAPEVAQKIKELQAKYQDFYKGMGDKQGKKSFDEAAKMVGFREEISAEDRSRIVFLSTICEDHTIEDARGEVKLDQQAQDFINEAVINDRAITAEQAALITRLAHHKYGSRLMDRLYGINLKNIQSESFAKGCAGFVAKELKNKGKLTDQEAPYAEDIFTLHIIEGAKKLSKLKLPGWVGPGLILLALFSGSINDILNTGGGGGEKDQQGG